MNNSELIIEAGRAERHYWRDLWRYRELFYFLAWRDLLVRYKQTAIGVAWSVVRPILMTLVFTFFRKAAKLQSAGIPDAIFVFAGMLPWQFFANSLTESSNSLISNANLISKIYFPRLIAPASAVIVSLVDLLISLVLMVLLLGWYQYMPDWRVITLPFFILLAFAASMGAGLWFGALNVKYRDFRYIVPFVVQFGLYVSPIALSSSDIPEKWRLLYYMNPMAGIIEGFRWSIFGSSQEIFMPGFALSCSLILLLLVTGVWYFRRTERSFADVI